MAKEGCIHQVGFEIVGITPLIQNKFSSKAIEQMLAKHMNLPHKKTAKNPRQAVRDAMIVNEHGVPCIPAVAIKAAMVSAMSQLKGAKKTMGRIAIFVEGNGVPIRFIPSKTPEAVALNLGGVEPRMDMVRCSGMSRTPDVRFRPQYNDWSARFVVKFNSDLFSVELIGQLIELAGRVGIGEWRPEKNGVHGQFRIEKALPVGDLQTVITECSPRLDTPSMPEWALDAEIDPDALRRMFDGTRAGAEDGLAQMENNDADDA